MVMTHTLINLPYAVDALEPVISKETIELHWGKHHRTYVDNLNKLIAGTEFEEMTLEEIVKKASGGMFNNAGQTLNHNLYFTQFSPDGGGQPKGKLLEAIEKQWESFDKFKAEFIQKAVGLFGSGWLWLSQKENGELVLGQYPNAGNPLTDGLNPLLTMDVWEHAYYLTNQNRRAEHAENFWKIVNWEVVESRMK